MPVTAEPEYYTVDEVAKRLRVSRRTIQRMIEAGELRALRVRDLYRIPRASLEQFEGHAPAD